jgi:MYXO-CTERM domain-containing protein
MIEGMGRACLALGLLLAFSRCSGDGVSRGQRALTTVFDGVVDLCPATTDWGAWDQTPISTWDADVQPIVSWIIARTGISCSTYDGHSPTIGRAADWRPHSRDEGTALANWFVQNTKSGGAPLGIDYIIWQAQIYQLSTGVKTLADRGSFTQNHCDHVHVSFDDPVSFDSAATTPWGTAPPPDAALPRDAKVQPSREAGPLLDRAGSEAATPPPDEGSAPLAPSTEPLTGGCAVAPGGAPSGLVLVLVALVGVWARRWVSSCRCWCRCRCTWRWRRSP